MEADETKWEWKSTRFDDTKEKVETKPNRQTTSWEL